VEAEAEAGGAVLLVHTLKATPWPAEAEAQAMHIQVKQQIHSLKQGTMFMLPQLHSEQMTVWVEAETYSLLVLMDK
jgi:hypothetical protein